MKRIVSFLLLWLAVASCAPKAAAPQAPVNWVPVADPAAMAADLETRRALIGNLSAEASARLVEPSRETVFSETFVVKPPCAFRVTVLGLFDRPQAYLASNCRELFLYDAANRRFFAGASNQRVMLDQFPLPLSSEEVIAALTGHPLGLPEGIRSGILQGPVQDPQRRGWRYDTPPVEGEFDSFWVDGETHEPVRWSRMGPDGEILVVEWQNRQGPERLPRRIQFFLPTRKSRLEIDYSDLSVNETGLDESLFTLQPPRGVPVERVGEGQ